MNLNVKCNDNDRATLLRDRATTLFQRHGIGCSRTNPRTRKKHLKDEIKSTRDRIVDVQSTSSLLALKVNETITAEVTGYSFWFFSFSRFLENPLFSERSRIRNDPFFSSSFDRLLFDRGETKDQRRREKRRKEAFPLFPKDYKQRGLHIRGYHISKRNDRVGRRQRFGRFRSFSKARRVRWWSARTSRFSDNLIGIDIDS